MLSKLYIRWHFPGKIFSWYYEKFFTAVRPILNNETASTFLKIWLPKINKNMQRKLNN